MGNSSAELERLARQHTVIKSGMGTLAVAPVDFGRPNLRILDSATADGLWLRDLDDAVGGAHTYVGTDINPDFFPTEVPAQYHFHLQSVAEEWPEDWNATFDYVHQRLVLSYLKRDLHDGCVKRLSKLARPGGWVEVVDSYLTGDYTNGPAVNRFEQMMRTFFDHSGTGSDYGAHIKKYIQEAGLEDVHEKVFDVPYGAACPDKGVARESIAYFMTSVRTLQALVSDPRSDAGGTEQFLEEVKKELEERGAWFRFVAVWGRAPLE